MQVYIGLDNVKENFENTVLTLGVFDGIHLAHQEIMKRTTQLATENEKESLCLTFNPHPQNILDNESKVLPILTTVKEKISILENYDLSGLIFIDLTKRFMNLSAEEFVQKVLVNKFKVSDVVVGYNYTFGNDKEGTTDSLHKFGEKYGFNTHIVSPIKYHNEVISSTLIRKLLQDGQVQKANKLLGRPYCIRGKVGHGEKIGRNLGFPTANIYIHEKEKLIPQNGVYFTSVIVEGDKYYGVSNVGIRPTFERDEKEVEVHILNLAQKNLYDKEVQLNFLERMRDEIKFDSADRLKQQINQDKKIGLEKIKQYKNGGQ